MRLKPQDTVFFFDNDTNFVLNLRSIKTNNLLAENSKQKKHITSMSCTLDPAIQSYDTGQRILFWQLSIDHHMVVHYQVNTQSVYTLDTLPVIPCYYKKILPAQQPIIARVLL